MKISCAALIFLFVIVLAHSSFAQSAVKLVSGPMLAQVEMRTAKIWLEVKPGSRAEILYWKKGNMGSFRRLQLCFSACPEYLSLRYRTVG